MRLLQLALASAAGLVGHPAHAVDRATTRSAVAAGGAGGRRVTGGASRRFRPTVRAWMRASDAERNERAWGEVPARAVREFGARAAAMSNDTVTQLTREGTSYSHTTTRVRNLLRRIVRTQGQVNSCWSHAYLDTVETAHYATTGEALDLSEAHQLREALGLRYAALIDQALGLTPGAPAWAEPVQEGGAYHVGPYLRRVAGLVPEKAFVHTVESYDTELVRGLLDDIVAEASDRAENPALGARERRALRTQYVARIAQDLDTYVGHVELGSDGKFEHRDPKGRVRRYTPRQFAARYVRPEGPYVTLTNYPAGEMDAWQFVDAGTGMPKGLAFNTQMAAIKRGIEGTIDRDRSSFVAYESGASNQHAFPEPDELPANDARFARVAGWMSTQLFRYGWLGSTAQLSKRAAYRNGRHAENHAVAIEGYNVGPDGATNRYLAKNSKGRGVMDEGYMHVRASADESEFMEYFVNVAAVHPEALPSELRATMRRQLTAFRDAHPDLGREERRTIAELASMLEGAASP